MIDQYPAIRKCIRQDDMFVEIIDMGGFVAATLKSEHDDIVLVGKGDYLADALESLEEQTAKKYHHK